AQVQTADPKILLDEARQYFDVFDYQHALTALTQAIPIIERASPQEPVHKQLARAYEMRARSRFGLGDQQGASADFVALLKADPSYLLVGEVSPNVVSLFNEALKTTVTSLKLTVTPPSAEVRLDHEIISPNGTIAVAVGEHVLEARRLGYRDVTRAI